MEQKKGSWAPNITPKLCVRVDARMLLWDYVLIYSPHHLGGENQIKSS